MIRDDQILPDNLPDLAPPGQSARRGASVTTPIDAAKQAVAVEELAERLCGRGTKRGREIAFRCPLHDDRDPSLRVDPAKALWYCDPCAVGGDVVDLARRAWGFPDDGRGAAEAAAFLLLEFGHDVPRRPPSWFRRQERQASVRDGLGRIKEEVLRRRLFRWVFEPMISAVEDANERAEMAAYVWRELTPLAARMVREARGAR